MQKIDKNLKILIGIAIGFVIGIGVFGIKTQYEIERLTLSETGQIFRPAEVEAPVEEKVILIIDNGTGNPQEFEMGVSEEATVTVFDLLKQTGITLEYTEYDIGIFINAIGGVWNDKKESKYWMYYINGEKAKLGVSKQIANPGDKIEFKFEKVSW